MRGSLIRPLVERIKNVSVMHILGGFIGVKGGGNNRVCASTYGSLTYHLTQLEKSCS